MTLERMGITSDIVSNGHQVVEAAATGRYDLILMDCEMPELDGFTATRQIREREPPGRRIPIIALTARGLDSDRLLCEAAGMDDYATKPFTRETHPEALAAGGHAGGLTRCRWRRSRMQVTAP